MQCTHITPQTQGQGPADSCPSNHVSLCWFGGSHAACWKQGSQGMPSNAKPPSPSDPTQLITQPSNQHLGASRTPVQHQPQAAPPLPGPTKPLPDGNSARATKPPLHPQVSGKAAVSAGIARPSQQVQPSPPQQALPRAPRSGQVPPAIPQDPSALPSNAQAPISGLGQKQALLAPRGMSHLPVGQHTVRSGAQEANVPRLHLKVCFIACADISTHWV